MYERNEPKIVKYKRHFTDDLMAENVIERKATRNPVQFVVADPGVAKPTALSQAKKDDIKEMLRFMPAQDKVFMRNAIN